MSETVGEALHGLLTENGLWPAEADAVLESVKSAKHTESLSEVLNRSWEGYPKPFHATAWMVVKALAVEYIDEHKPKHFARPMFTDELPREHH